MKNHNQKPPEYLTKKWAYNIISELHTKGTLRFGELEKYIHSISPRSLAARLQDLELKNIISRKVFACVPLKVEYTITEKGIRAFHALKALYEI